MKRRYHHRQHSRVVRGSNVLSGIAVVAIASTGLTGCVIFDASLLESSAETGAGDSTGSDDGSFLELSDQCPLDLVDMPELLSSPVAKRVVATNVRQDTVRALSCGQDQLNGALGPEGFFKFHANAGERWRLLARPLAPDVDVVLYALQGCRTEKCIALRDRCSAGLEEAFTFFPPEEADYGIGVDARGPLLGEIEVTLLQQICGNGEQEPGESCDDGNAANGDGCSSDCRFELIGDLATADLEGEPNNGLTEANRLILTNDVSGEAAATGTAAARCDDDFFVVAVPFSHTLDAILLDGAGQPCSPPQIPAGLTLTVSRASNNQILAVGEPTAESGSCPAVSLPDLQGDDYFISITSAPDVEAFNYQLDVRVTLPE